MSESWNKKDINFKDKKFLRKLFFQKKSIKYICFQTDLTQRIIYRIVKDNNWIKKRERYWLYIIRYAYRNNKSIKYIYEKCDINSINILRRIKQKYNVKTKRFNISNKIINYEIEQKMILDYKNLMSAKKIANRYGFKNHKTVLDVLKKYEIKRREPKIITYYNTDYFEKIDTNDKAYILGLLLTDGYIFKDYKGFGIQLKEEDGYILKRIAYRMGESASVVFISNENKRKKAKLNGDKYFINVQDMNRLMVHNKKIANDLKKLGMVRNKTFILRSPKISKKYLGAFFRGMWDGDGTIGIAKTGNIWCKIISASELFLKDLMLFNVPFEFTLKNIPPNLYKLRLTGGNKKTISFLKWIYKDKSDLFLRRKYEKVQNKIC